MPGVLVVGKRSADVIKTFACKRSNEGGASAATNRANLQAELDAYNFEYPWFFPAGTATMAGVELDTTLKIPASTGVHWIGPGMTFPEGGTGLTSMASFVRIRAETYRTDFDGTTNKLTTAANLTITHTTTDTPIVVTAAGHGMATGGIVMISGITGNTNANGTYRVVVIDEDTFSLRNFANGDEIEGGPGSHGGTPVCRTSKCIPVGRAVVAQDVDGSVDITAGTAVSPYRYGIVGASPGASGVGYWVLDGGWNTGAVTNGQGYYCPEIVQSAASQAKFENLTFTFQRIPGTDSDTGTVCFHVLTNNGLTITSPVGKHTFEKCSFGHAEVGILYGPTLAGYNAAADAGWYGYDHDHSDHGVTRDCMFGPCKTCIVTNNEQSVCHSSYNDHAQSVSNAFMQLNAGGRNAIYNLSMSGRNNSGDTQYIFDVGRNYNGLGDECNVFGGHTDRNNCRNPGLIKTRWTGLNKMGQFNFYGFSCTRNQTHDSLYVIDVQSQAMILVDSCRFVDYLTPGLWANSIRVKNGATSATYKPRILIRNVMIASGVAFHQCITSDSDDGIYIQFTGCYTTGCVPLPDRVWLKGTGYVEYDETTDTWVAMDPQP